MSHAMNEASAAAILTDEEGRVLIVKPTYKPGWNLPGGRIDEGETPRRACERELLEELGVKVAPGRLLAHAYMAPPGQPGGHAYYVFDGGALTVEQQEAIRLQESELAECRFSFPADIAVENIPPSVRPLWSAALRARESGVPAYLELPQIS